MNKKDVFIDSVSYIQKELKLGGTQPPKAHLVRRILRKDVKMRFK